MEEALERVIMLCREGFSNYDKSKYGEIVAALSIVEQTDAVAKMTRLAEAGPRLGSARFAFPHIEDAAVDALAAISAKAVV